MFSRSVLLPRRSLSSFRSFSSLQQLTKPTVTLPDTGLLIGGSFQAAESGKTFPTIDPRNEEIITQIAEADAADVDKAVRVAREAFDVGPWPRMSGRARGKILYKIADMLEANQQMFSELETWDNGKPLTSSAGDIYLCIEHFRYFAGWADKLHGETIPCENYGGQQYWAYTTLDPVGVCGCIIPWNFPLLMAAWKLAPLLATGNTAVVKVAEQTPLTALAFGKLMLEAGLPEGVVNILPGYGETAGQALARHPLVDKVGFTGSTEVGRLVMAAAAPDIKRVSLELGGKSPAIVFNDADVDKAVADNQVALFLNQGQCCCAGSRLFVQEGVYDEFVSKTVEATKARTVGDPFTDVDQGPQVSKEQFDKILGLLERGREEGANVLTGGDRFGDKGYFVKPTVSEVDDSNILAQEEIFGPCMQIHKFKTVDEVIKRANATNYGLAAGVWTKNIETANTMSRALRAGTVWVNCYDIFDACLPFGGFKQSGFGRDKGKLALENYTEPKVVVHEIHNSPHTN